MEAVSAVFMVLAVLGGIYYICSTAALVVHFCRWDKVESGDWRVEGPKISILKPVSGADACAKENFQSFLNLDYSNYEVLFGVLNPQDSAVPIIEDIVKQSERAFLHVGSSIEGSNNKVRILHNLALHAEGDIFVIADSDTRATPDFLKQIAGSLSSPDTGVVSCIYRGINGISAADALEGLHMTCVFAPGVAAAECVTGVDFALGAALAVRRNVLEKIGGFEAIADYLADDFQIGHRAAAVGYGVKVSQYVVDITLSKEPLINVLARELRWARTTAVSRPAGHAGLIITFGFAYALIFWLLSGFSSAGLAVVGCVTAARALSAYTGAKVLNDREFYRRAWLLPVRDLLSFAIWIAGYMGRTVHWRGRKLRLLKDGRMRDF